jgi:hypothetical protein
MKQKNAAILFFACTCLFFSCGKKEYKDVDCSAHPHLYSAHIKPIISTSCAIPGCHVAGFADGDFTSYSGVKASIDAGKFQKAVLYKKNMPESGPLPLEERQKINCWIEDGAPDN